METESENNISSSPKSFSQLFTWDLSLGLVSLSLGIAIFALFLSINSIRWKSISLLFAVSGILLGLLRLSNIFFNLVPEGHSKRIASSSGIFTMALYYLLNGQSIVWLAFSLLLIFYSSFGLYHALWGILLERAILQKLYKAYKANDFPNLPVPFTYVLAEPGWGVFLSHRFVNRIINSLWKHRYLPEESKLSVYNPQSKKRSRYLWANRQRGMILFLVSDSVRRYPSSFRKWLISQAAAFLVVNTTLSDDEINEIFEPDFNEEAMSGYQMCSGPTFMIQPSGISHISTAKADQTLEYYSSRIEYYLSVIENQQFDNNAATSKNYLDNLTPLINPLDHIVAPLVNRLASNALPIAASDARLTKNARSLIPEIASGAIPPIADAYLRFRLAQSDVERFLSTLNCIESLIKCSVIFLLVNRWSETGTDVSNKTLAGGPLTLGSWINLLRKLTDLDSSNVLDEEICKFWKSDLSQIQKDMIGEVGRSGLPLPDRRIFNQLDWLEWLRDFRNVTRGHGVVEEKSVAPFWHLLHQIFLEFVSALRPLVFSSTLVAIEPNGKQIPLQGWNKGGRRPEFRSHELQGCRILSTLKIPSGQTLLLYPLFMISSDKVLLWERLRKQEKTIEFLNYGSWERDDLPISDFSDVDPYNIWREMSHGDMWK